MKIFRTLKFTRPSETGQCEKPQHPMLQLDDFLGKWKEHWMPKHWCFQAVVVLEKTLESPLDSREMQPVNPKGNQRWIFIGKTDASSRTKSQKRGPFHHRGLECKSRKSRDTWRNRQIWPCTRWGKAKANRVLPREGTGHSKHPLPTTQEKALHMDITIWSTPKSDWLYSLQPKMKKLSTVSKNKTGSWLWLRSWTPYCQILT